MLALIAHSLDCPESDGLQLYGYHVVNYEHTVSSTEIIFAYWFKFENYSQLGMKLY